MISATVIITVSIQVYRNVQNYKLNKQRFVNDVQQALDLSVEAYYADQVKGDIVVFSAYNDFADVGGFNRGPATLTARRRTTTKLDSTFFEDFSFSDIPRRTEMSSNFRDTSFSLSIQRGITLRGQEELDSLLRYRHSSIQGLMVDSSTWVTDTLNDIQNLANRLIISLTQDLDFVRMDSFLIKELGRKNIKVEYALLHNVRDSLRKSNDKNFPLYTVAKSTYLPDGQELEMNFENASMIILKRGALDLLISLLISGAVIGSLMYLYRVITEQKQLAEIKNDLISNITHEFKTPIATVSTAIEAISNFNQTNDKEKTAKYLDISSNQLNKLNGMVEKLLETASLDSDELDLNLESVELVKFTQQIFERFHVIKGDKKLVFQTEMSEHNAEMDIFHMENAVANLVDNAIKYGGDEIIIKLSEEEGKVVWQVIDNAHKLDKLQQERIFDQFYRVPTGNLHDVKGFGIGLYYTKKIVEKHQGNISVNVSSSNTNFTIAI